MNESIKNIIAFSSKFTAQTEAMSKISNIITAQSKISKAFDNCTTISKSYNLLSRYENLAKSIDFVPQNSIVEPLKSVNNISQSIITIQEFIRTQLSIEKLNFPFYPSLATKYLETNNNPVWSSSNSKSYWAELEYSKFQNSSKNLQYYKTLQSFAEHDASKQLQIKDAITQRIYNVLYDSTAYDHISNHEFYSSVNNRLDISFVHKQSLENLKNFIINGNFDFTYTNGLEDFLWHNFIKIEELEETINHTKSELKFLNKIIISISNSLKKSALNKRDFFRKINCFHFKNLDDEYYSFLLTT